MSNSRIQYLDIIKFISIILVIFCHNPVLKSNSIIGNLLMLLCWAAVPLFFMSTGAIYLNRKYDFNKWKKKILKTYLVLIIWKIIYLIFFTIYKNVNILQISKGIIIKYIFFFGEIDWIQTGHMWFIYAYVGVLLIYPLILRCFETDNIDYKRYLKVILLLIFIVSFVKNDVNIALKVVLTNLNKNVVDVNTILCAFPFSQYANMLFFFIMGGYLSKNKILNKIGKNKTIMLSLVFVTLGLLCHLLIRYSYTNTFTWDGKYLNNGYGYTSTVILSVSMFILLQTLNFKLNKLMSLISTNTLGIFYMHVIILNILQPYFTKFGLLHNFIKTFIVLIISTTICYIAKKIKILKEIF